jgi:predicted TIM-barrel fold metal-dependent hydrolase
VSLGEVIRAEIDVVDGVAVFDVHSHTGVDIDGSTRTCEEQVEALAEIGGRSVIFPFCVTGGYEAENRRVVEESRSHPDTLVPFARLDPRVATAADAADALAAGARGFKLHPRAEDFRLDHPGVEAIAGVAAEARVPVLIHAGIGVGSFGRTLTDLAQRHRECPIVLAHAAVSDLCWLWEEVPDHPNLFFDTSWWNASDLIALFSLVPPGQVLFGSDAPYMDVDVVLAIALRCARYVGLSPEALELLAGRQLDNLLAGEEAVDAGPAPGPPKAALTPTAGRVVTALAAAGGARLGNGDPAQMLELARLAMGADGAGLGDSGALISALLEESMSAAWDARWAQAMAFTLLLTPGVESPVSTV